MLFIFSKISGQEALGMDMRDEKRSPNNAVNDNVEQDEVLPLVFVEDNCDGEVVFSYNDTYGVVLRKSGIETMFRSR